MLRPVHARGHKLDGRRVDDVNGLAKAVGNSFAAAPASKAGTDALQMRQHLPEKLLGQLRLALLAGVREAVAAGMRGSANRGERATVQAQPIADVIEPDAVGELGIEQRNDMTPGREAPAALVHARPSSPPDVFSTAMGRL
jgi:hypothetical protein